MRALRFDGKLKLEFDAPVPKPETEEALIKILMAGVCQTDIEISKGYMGFRGILGHEFVGQVEKVSGKQQDLVGKRVVGEINCGCGECSLCKSGLERHCQQRDVLGILNRDGCFAEYMTLPVRNLHLVPDYIEDESAVFCEPLAAAYEILEQIDIKPAQRVLVLGDGKLGLLIALVIQQTKADLTLAGKRPNKLRLATDYGIHAIPVQDLDQRLYDVTVEATGAEGGFELALSKTCPCGTLILKSTLAGKENLDLAPVVIDEISILGSRCGPFAPALMALEAQIDVKPLISAVYPLDMALNALDQAIQPETLKVLLDMRRLP